MNRIVSRFWHKTLCSLIWKPFTCRVYRMSTLMTSIVKVIVKIMNTRRKLIFQLHCFKWGVVGYTCRTPWTPLTNNTHFIFRCIPVYVCYDQSQINYRNVIRLKTEFNSLYTSDNFFKTPSYLASSGMFPLPMLLQLALHF